MLTKDDVVEFLKNDHGLDLLKTIDDLNPINLPTNRLCTIKEVCNAMNMPLKEGWKFIDQAYDCGLVVYYGGVLSRKRVDLTEIGEKLCECNTAEDVKGVLNAI